MKVIIAGSRTFNDYKLMKTELNILLAPEVLDREIEIISGCQKTYDKENKTYYGADYLGEKYAKENNIPVKPFPADWNNLSHPDAVIKTNSFGKKYDAKAGERRNKQMAEYATHCICFWDGKSAGTKNMIELAESHELIIQIIHFQNHPSKNNK